MMMLLFKTLAYLINVVIGPVALQMSAFGGKADMTVCGKSAFAVAIGGKADIALTRSHARF